MDHDFWHNKWEKNEIGFHEKEINRHLKQFWHKLELKKDAPVFVPFCGKSRDMLWLAEQGHPVVGGELSPIAAEAFFRENGIMATQKKNGNFTLWESENIKILCGDFFKLHTDDLQDVKAVYDRAALIALPPHLRSRYSRQLMKCLQPGTKVLLVTLEYPQDEMKGPPFSVSQDEVKKLFGNEHDVTLLLQNNILEDNLHFKDRGLTQLEEKVYIISHS
ncbi:MAG: thiopurine S-methyltransferase [Thermodesulfovibrionia bacterium]|nr:thiopurine S-methyltransferase [Thermodesulfovibrionia bacterium]